MQQNLDSLPMAELIFKHAYRIYSRESYGIIDNIAGVNTELVRLL
jgi:hypothetical protein